jgi:hypothetical protein
MPTKSNNKYAPFLKHEADRPICCGGNRERRTDGNRKKRRGMDEWNGGKSKWGSQNGKKSGLGKVLLALAKKGNYSQRPPLFFPLSRGVFVSLEQRGGRKRRT